MIMVCTKVRSLLAWDGPESNWFSKRLWGARSPLIIRSPYSFKRPKIGDNHNWLSSTSFVATKLFWCDKHWKKDIEFFFFFCGGCLLFQRGIDQTSLRCIVGDEVAKVLKEVHARDCSENQGGSTYSNRLFVSVSWPTVDADAISFKVIKSTSQLLNYKACPLHDHFIVVLWFYWDYQPTFSKQHWIFAAIKC